MPILEHFGQNAHLHEKVYHLDIYKQGISAHFEWSLTMSVLYDGRPIYKHGFLYILSGLSVLHDATYGYRVTKGRLLDIFGHTKWPFTGKVDHLDLYFVSAANVNIIVMHILSGVPALYDLQLVIYKNVHFWKCMD